MPKNNNHAIPSYHPPKSPLYDIPLSFESMETLYKDSSDFVSRPVRIGASARPNATLCFIDGLVSGGWVSENIMWPLWSFGGEKNGQESCSPEETADQLAQGGVYNAVAVVCEQMDKAVSLIATGSALLFIEGSKRAVAFEAKGFPVRGVQEPSDESVIKGAKDSFVESVRSNTANVRRRISTAGLCISERVLGRQSRTTVSVVYIEGLTNPELVAEVKRRIGEIDTDAIILSSQIEERLTNKKKSIIPHLFYTERCDRFCNSIIEGRIGVLVDGIPMGYLMPASLAELLHATEDLSINMWVASAVRLLRYLALFLAIILPAVYLAIDSYHQVMFPTQFALSIQAAKRDVPFPTIIEIFVMLFSFEIMLEAGLRLPKPVGQAMSILSALVVGQAAVEARLVSPIIVIIIALTGICGFTIPNQDLSGAVRLWRIGFVIIAAIGGLFGVLLGLVVLIYYMASQESFGVAFLTPLSAGNLRRAARKMFWREPIDAEKERDPSLKTVNQRSKK